MLALVFFLWGNITAINSTLILFFFEYFHISWQQAILINVLFYTAPFLPCSALMAGMGGAIIPWVQALIIDYVGLRASFILPIGLYISLALWGVMSIRQTRVAVSQPSLAG